MSSKINDDFSMLHFTSTESSIYLVNITIIVANRERPYFLVKYIRLLTESVRSIQSLISNMISTEIKIPERYSHKNLYAIFTGMERHSLHSNVVHQNELSDKIQNNSILSVLQELYTSYSYLVSDLAVSLKRYESDRSNLDLSLLATNELWNKLCSFIKILYIIFVHGDNILLNVNKSNKTLMTQVSEEEDGIYPILISNKDVSLTSPRRPKLRIVKTK
jgi:hypothetical protein